MGSMEQDGIQPIHGGIAYSFNLTNEDMIGSGNAPVMSGYSPLGLNQGGGKKKRKSKSSKKKSKKSKKLVKKSKKSLKRSKYSKKRKSSSKKKSRKKSLKSRSSFIKKTRGKK